MSDISSEDEHGFGDQAASGRSATLRWGLRSNPGAVRSVNEDCAGVAVHDSAPGQPAPGQPGPSPLFVLADGMGGHTAGDVASRVAVDSALAGWAGGGEPTSMRSVVRAANLAVMDAAMAPGRQGMGTTMTALCFESNTAVIGHVGDSRAYLVRGASCIQITADHSRVAEMVRTKLLSPEQAAHHPLRSQLTRSLGIDPLVQVDLVRERVEERDTIVLCTDGIWDVVDRPEIARIVIGMGPEWASSALVDLAVERESTDNVTALVVEVQAQPVAPESRRSFFRRRS